MPSPRIPIRPNLLRFIETVGCADRHDPHGDEGRGAWSHARAPTPPHCIANPSAVFPRFSYPDVNFWIWVFGRRYRQVVRSWEESVHGPDRAADRRTNWSGAALSTFYQAVRHALVVAIIIRGLATLGGIAGLTWWILRTVKVGGEL